jgi:hypothetical protein
MYGLGIPIPIIQQPLQISKMYIRIVRTLKLVGHFVCNFQFLLTVHRFHPFLYGSVQARILTVIT